MKTATRVSSKLLFVITIPLAGLLAAALLIGAADKAGAYGPKIERFEAVLDTPAVATTEAVSQEELAPGWQTVFTTTFEGDFRPTGPSWTSTPREAPMPGESTLGPTPPQAAPTVAGE